MKKNKTKEEKVRERNELVCGVRKSDGHVSNQSEIYKQRTREETYSGVK